MEENQIFDFLSQEFLTNQSRKILHHKDFVLFQFEFLFWEIARGKKITLQKYMTKNFFATKQIHQKLEIG